jgi:tetratricopeptide (TPR) repeat protein
LACSLSDKQRKWAIAYQFAKRAVEVNGKSAYAWMNLGRIADEFYRFDEAERAFQKALKLAKTDDQRGAIYINLSAALVNKGEWAKAVQIAKTGLQLKPDNKKLRANLGMANLALGQWQEGWKNYDEIISFDTSRGRIKYAQESDWDGRPGQRVVVYGEQGLGDEISFASMIPDLADVSSRVLIDCDRRLEGLFKRSFPDCEVHGTRWDTQINWLPEIDASITMGGLGKFFRTKDSQFPKRAYLKADPERVEMWRGLFDKIKKPVIGISWSAGLFWTAGRFRKLTLEDLLPVFNSVDAVWVSLQYKDASEEIAAFREKHPQVDLRQYAWATLTNDYDDTAALVSALDKVVSMQQSVIHLAGGLGKETHVFVNKHSQWRYGRDEMPWYPNVKLYRQRLDNTFPVKEVAKCLSA